MNVFQTKVSLKKLSINICAYTAALFLSLLSTQPAFSMSNMPPTNTPPVEARADRCSEAEDGSMKCSYLEKNVTYQCNGRSASRKVRWQIPDGTPPKGGWPVVFYYESTSSATINPFADSAPLSTDPEAPINSYRGYTLRLFQEFLDDPENSGIRYAVIAAQPPKGLMDKRYWNTNNVFPYSISCDNQFLPKLFADVKNGIYGDASHFNMKRRYATGFSSGGYNVSRMAVTFNKSRRWWQSCDKWCNKDSWRALGIISASYASCAGPLCTVPSLPKNHPPTKFWHSPTDIIVPYYTAEWYYYRLQANHTPVEFVTHNIKKQSGHYFDKSIYGQTGVKEWFDKNP